MKRRNPIDMNATGGKPVRKKRVQSRGARPVASERDMDYKFKYKTLEEKKIEALEKVNQLEMQKIEALAKLSELQRMGNIEDYADDLSEDSGYDEHAYDREKYKTDSYDIDRSFEKIETIPKYNAPPKISSITKTLKKCILILTILL